MLAQSLAGLPLFLLYFGVAAILAAVYVFVYTRMTSHDEFALIREGNAAAAVALGMSFLGFSAPLATAISRSATIVDCAIWGLIAIAVQIIVYYVVKMPLPGTSDRIERGDLAAAIWLGFASLAAGIVNAACMSG